jgi:hypothetical protein
MTMRIKMFCPQKWSSAEEAAAAEERKERECLL